MLCFWERNCQGVLPAAGLQDLIKKLLDFYNSVSTVYFILGRSFTCCHNLGSKADTRNISVGEKD